MEVVTATRLKESSICPNEPRHARSGRGGRAIARPQPRLPMGPQANASDPGALRLGGGA